jgi:putative cardiolipin synthase
MRHAFALALSFLLAGCAHLPQRMELADESALPPAASGNLAELVLPAEQRHPNQSGFHLVSTGTEAYAARAFSAQGAASSLDIQTYIWHADLTGKLLALQALKAADRGVRVRILVDDLDARAKNTGFAALDAHPDIEVRLFNPTASRSGALSKASEFGTNFGRLNHRMHNKSWIADNRIALVGGRNLGDEYFDAHEGINFVDLDLLMAGPVVGQVSDNFDRFWNSPSNYPIAQLAPDAATDAALVQLRGVLDQAAIELRSSPYAKVLREDARVQDLMDGDTRLHWSKQWTFTSDDPMKAKLPLADRSEVLKVLVPAMRGTRQALRLISPYFVPGEMGTGLLVEGAKSGREVLILTNSLAANDVAAVHGGYMEYRDDLLRGGVQLWELKPTGTPLSKFTLGGSSGSSLHTKAMIVDADTVFVGSYNLDPRSTSLNSEQGVLVSHPALAAELTRIFERQVSPQRAWQVTLDDAGTLWSDGTQTFRKEPEASASRRFMAWLMKVLPVESQL